MEYEDKDNHMDVTKLKERALEEHVKSSGNERLRLEFRQNCKLFLLKMVSKLCEKAPIKYPLVRSLSVLDPRVLLNDKEFSVQKLTTILRFLVETGRIEDKCCDETLREFGCFFDHHLMSTSDAFRKFSPQSERLDEFYHELLSNKDEFRHLWEVVKLCLLLSHGQASVERGFSINKEMMVENLKEHSLIAQRLIHDHVHFVGGLQNIGYTKELLLSASASRQKYQMYLDDERRQKQDQQKQQKRKTLMDEISEMKVKKKRMEEDVKTLVKSADSNAEKAESEGKLYLISKSNGLRRAAKEKEKHLEVLEKTMGEKIKELNDTL